MDDEDRGPFDPATGDGDLDPPLLSVDLDELDPVDARVLNDLLDEADIPDADIDAEGLLDVGLNYMQINRFEQAADAFERAAHFATDRMIEQEAWTNKGVAHAELEEYDDAIGAYREALSIDDRNDHAAVAETNLAYALWEIGRDDDALFRAERAVEIDPRLPHAWYNRAYFAAERGLYEDARLAVENAERLGMRNLMLLELKVEILEELGEDEAAEAALEQATEHRERDERRLVE